VEEGIPSIGVRWTTDARCDWYAKWMKRPAENPCPVKPIRQWIEAEQKSEQSYMSAIYDSVSDEIDDSDSVAETAHEAGDDPDWNLTLNIPNARAFVTDPKNLRRWLGDEINSARAKALLTARGLAWANFNMSEQNKRQCALYTSYRKLELRKLALISAIQSKCPGVKFQDLLQTPRLEQFHKSTGVKYDLKALRQIVGDLKSRIPELGYIMYAALQVQVVGDQWNQFRVNQRKPEDAKTDADVEKAAAALAEFDDERSDKQHRHEKEAEEAASRKPRKPRKVCKA